MGRAALAPRLCGREEEIAAIGEALERAASGQPAVLLIEGEAGIGQRLYISGRTVQTHLAHVFAKLDISARAQLAVEVSRHGLTSCR